MKRTLLPALVALVGLLSPPTHAWAQTGFGFRLRLLRPSCVIQQVLPSQPQQQGADPQVVMLLQRIADQQGQLLALGQAQQMLQRPLTTTDPTLVSLLQTLAGKLDNQQQAVLGALQAGRTNDPATAAALAQLHADQQLMLQVMQQLLGQQGKQQAPAPAPPGPSVVVIPPSNGPVQQLPPSVPTQPLPPSTPTQPLPPSSPTQPLPPPAILQILPGSPVVPPSVIQQVPGNPGIQVVPLPDAPMQPLPPATPGQVIPAQKLVPKRFAVYLVYHR